jgi:hypothetical protein
MMASIAFMEHLTHGRLGHRQGDRPGHQMPAALVPECMEVVRPVSDTSEITSTRDEPSWRRPVSAREHLTGNQMLDGDGLVHRYRTWSAGNGTKVPGPASGSD